jgi:UDP-N-acetylglucosamine--N-acetylmuramyl-(pentapeptide) pyrophosphoryl-undecaprenol N-acetylglucosamine transferase
VKKFLISCGGTGGHLSPGIALAEGLIARGHEARLLISRKKVDGRLIEKYPQFRFERMPGTGFAWNPLQLAKCSLSQSQALWFCLRLIRSMRPDAVVGFGGFTSAPVVLAARVAGVPSALHESNRVPGRAVRTLGRLATRVFLPPGIQVPRLKASKVHAMGLPVRREFARRSPLAARTALGLDPAQPLLVVLGGSQGASALNEWARRHVEAFARDGIQLFVVTGLGKGNEETLTFRAHSGATTRAVFAPFSDRMAELISAADLVVSRAGAGTLAELARCETPAILVPYPLAADNHQQANAEYFVRQGGGVVIPQPHIAQLYAMAREMLGDSGRLEKLRVNLRQLDDANSLELMLDDLESIARSDRSPRTRSFPVAAT